MEENTSKEEEKKEDAAGQDATPVEKETSKEQEKKSQGNATWIIVLVVVLGMGGLYYYNQNKDGGNSAMNTESFTEVNGDDPAQWSYALGMILGQQLEQMLTQDPSVAGVDNDMLTQGINDVLSGNELKISIEESQTIMEARAQEAQAAAEGDATQNQAAGQAYIDEYAQTQGVVKTENGSLYTVKTIGEGAPVGDGTAVVQYSGRLVDGTEFDSSNKNGVDTPVPFDPASVIPGFGETLAQMKKGSQWEIVIPADQAYGEQGVPGLIAPNSALIFEVTVIDIEPTE